MKNIQDLKDHQYINTLKNNKKLEAYLKGRRSDYRENVLFAIHYIANRQYWEMKIRAGKKYKIPIYYIELHHHYMRKIVGRSWCTIAKDLVNLGIFERTNYSTKGSMNKLGRAFSRSYRITPRLFQGTWEIVAIKARKASKAPKVDTKIPCLSMPRFTMDLEKALEALPEIAKARKWRSFTANQYHLHLIYFDEKNGVSYSKSGRQSNKCNATPRELRKFIKRDGVACEELDVKSCAPTILLNFFSDPMQRKRWKDLIDQGIFYEAIAADFKTDRQGGKNLFKYWLGGWDKSPLREWMEKNFPDLTKQSENLAILTQAEESKIFVGAAKGKAWCSIHDGLLLPITEMDEAMKFVEDKFREILNLDVIITKAA